MPGPVGPERFGDPGRGDHGAHRQVAAGDALRARHDVGLEPEPVDEANQSPQRPKPGDHLVGDEQHAGVAADLARRLQVAVRRREHAAGADHGFAEERGDPAGAGPLDRVAQRVGVVPRHLDHVLDQLAVARRVGGDAGERGPGRVHAVVGLLAPDQDRAVGLADELPVAARHLRGGVDRIRAAAGEEHLRARRSAPSRRPARPAPRPGGS